MARIVELTYPDNVALAPGAVQNWVDLDSPGATSPLLHGLVGPLLDGPARRCLVLGPHDPVLLRTIVERGHDLTVVVRSIPDAATIGTDLPAATALCGTVDRACAGHEPYDLVIALDDVTRTLSLEDDQHRTWRELADGVVRQLAPGGTLLLGIENELGLHRLTAPIDPRMRDDDANWSPLATWDASRPRTDAQVDRFRRSTGMDGATYQAFASWSAPSVLAADIDRAPQALRDLLAALVGLPTGPAGAPPAGSASVAPGVLERRALAMADALPRACAGWVLVLGPDVPAEPEPVLLHQLGPGSVHWTALDDQRVRRSPADPAGPAELSVPVPPQGRTLLVELVEAAVDSDTPRLRALLTGWRQRLEALAVDGLLPAEHADARFANLLSGATEVDTDPGRAAGQAVPLAPAAGPAPLDEACWAALGDLLTTWLGHGFRHPWPSSMHRRTVFEALVAMAGTPAPQDPARWFDVDATPSAAGSQTRQELVAVIERQKEELRGAWSRFHWDEREYLVHKASTLGRRTLGHLRREGLRRTLGRLRRLLRP